MASKLRSEASPPIRVPDILLAQHCSYPASYRYKFFRLDLNFCRNRRKHYHPAKAGNIFGLCSILPRENGPRPGAGVVSIDMVFSAAVSPNCIAFVLAASWRSWQLGQNFFLQKAHRLSGSFHVGGSPFHERD
jgi:hypothetical protein